MNPDPQAPPVIGVCSWSLQPRSPADLVAKLNAAGARSVQLALDPLRTRAWPVEETVLLLAEAGIAIRSGMMAMAGEDYSTLASIARSGGVRPDATWSLNLVAAGENARLAGDLGLELVTWHAGVLPEGRDDPERKKLLERVARLTDVFAEQGVTVGLETGQETAETLLDVLEELDHPRLGVNFDPANMILYDRGEPLEALRLLAGHVRQIHVKDALRTRVAGEWGSEVCAGTGEVDWAGFFAVMREAELRCDLMIEREAGGSRIDDIRAARLLVERQLAPGGGT